MNAGVFIPLAAFAVVVLIVALVATTRLRDVELEVQRRLHIEELEHRQKMTELELRLERIRTGTPGAEEGPDQ